MTSSSPDKDLFDELVADDEFDPLEDNLPDDDEDSDEVVELIGATELTQQAAEAAETPEAVDERTAEERTADLFKSMAQRRKTLLGILAFVAQPQTAEAVSDEVDRLQENNFSVYTAANYCNLLEKAGAIRLITAEGTDFSQAKVEPRLVEVDGVEYYEPGTPPQAFWVATEVGTAQLDADKPLERLRELFDADGAYLSIYKRVLTRCALDGGATTKSLGDAVDADPLVQKPRLYAPRFIDRLEKCDAIVWVKTWQITDIGTQGLELLADVTDDYVPEADVTPPAALATSPAAPPSTGSQTTEKG
jgi:hypothetical protein